MLNRRMPICTTVVQTANDTFQLFIRLKMLPKSFGIVQLSTLLVLVVGTYLSRIH